jgi:hypothetical protein
MPGPISISNACSSRHYRDFTQDSQAVLSSHMLFTVKFHQSQLPPAENITAQKVNKPKNKRKNDQHKALKGGTKNTKLLQVFFVILRCSS